jgi:(p)ppGpp synthase/HD superfamily hydrolase
MNKLNKAIILSAKIHSGKKGRNNEPAVLHPIRVMNQMKSNKGKIVGVLHDVVETEKISIDDLAAQGFGKSVCKTVDALSRRKWEKYDDYINRLKKNKLAIKVKLEDLIDNYSRRLSNKKKSKIDLKKIKKYEKAYKSLTGEKIQANF